MSSPIRGRVFASFSALVFAGVGMAATAAPASAALATTPPAYVGNTAVDPNSNGNFLLYDANGNRIVGGSLTNLGGAIYAVSGQTARTGAIKANLSIAAPDHTKVASLWASQTLSGSTNFPVAGTIPNVSGVAGPVVTLNGTTDGNAASFLSVAVLDTTAGYAGYAQLRVKDTATPAATTWATMEIAIDVAAGTWAQVTPAVSYTATTTSAPTFSPVSPVAGGTAVTLTSTVSPSNATGSVHFFDGATDLGAATFTGGTATLTNTFTNTSATGAAVSHSITAVYTPTGLFSASTSAASALSVTYVKSNTTTNLTLSAATVAQPGAITATAAVTSGSAAVSAGSVAFYIDGAATPSATVATSAGSATFNIDSNALTAGNHTIVAVYTDGNLYNGSTSSPASTFAVTAPCFSSCSGDVQNIQTSIARWI
jgi:Bacterial Ig-like domain (group 3)